RYCPSIEDKIVRFSDKPRHQVFLEPEGRNTEEVYVQGLSTSLPEYIQHDIVRSVPGLENAEMMRSGYAIEYDSLPPRSEEHTSELQSRFDLVCRLLLEKKKKKVDRNAPQLVKRNITTIS